MLWVGREKEPVGENATLDRLLLAALAVTIAIQLGWTASTARYDWGHRYSASRVVAKYLRDQRLEDARIYATGYFAFAIQPYFQVNLFDNYRARAGPAYWDWSTHNPIVDNYQRILRAGPEIVIVGVKDPEQQIFLESPERFFPGYRPTVFRGALFWKNRPLEWDAFVVYRRVRRGALRRRRSASIMPRLPTAEFAAARRSADPSLPRSKRARAGRL